MQTFTQAPTDIDALFANWLGATGHRHADLVRGMPESAGPMMARPHAAMKIYAPFGTFIKRITRRHERGAYGYAYGGGVLEYDPIGAGVVVPWKIPVEPGRTARVVDGTLFWNTTPTNRALVPAIGPAHTPQEMIALLGVNAYDAVTGNPYNTAPAVGFYP
jgi:hypothetical protein